MGQLRRPRVPPRARRYGLLGNPVGKERVDEFTGSKTAVFKKGLVDNFTLDKKIPTLLVLRGAETGLRIAVKQSRVTLGRTIDADIVLNDRLISRQHAELTIDAESGVYRLVDLGSTNGTFVNDRVIDCCDLTDGDKIFVGSTILKFVLEDEVDSASGELFDKLMFEDDLTGLVVRRRFDNDLRVHLQSARALGKSISLLMMDMDGLKAINDTHGHQVGAFVIAETGKKIGSICNELGQACRYGGDEFIAYLLEVTKDEAAGVAERVCEAVRAHSLQFNDLELYVSISIGVATFPEDATTVETLTKAADAALYRAKGAGRDRVST